jgi:ELWxxDGT repeat protein
MPFIVGDHVFFFLSSQLWASDGTASGTRRLADLTSTEPFITGLASIDGKLFFLDHPNRDGITDLWTSDGTPEGTVKLRSFDAPH